MNYFLISHTLKKNIEGCTIQENNFRYFKNTFFIKTFRYLYFYVLKSMYCTALTRVIFSQRSLLITQIPSQKVFVISVGFFHFLLSCATMFKKFLEYYLQYICEGLRMMSIYLVENICKIKSFSAIRVP